MRESRWGRELIIDGTLASFFQEGRVDTGSGWDALAAPLLVLPPERRRQILLLGLGGHLLEEGLEDAGVVLVAGVGVRRF